MSNNIQCEKVEAAKSLIEELSATEIPENYDPGELNYDEILANIRHEFTNCDELYWAIPDCDICTWDVSEEGYECPEATYAHDEIKWAAKGLAEKIYREWLDKRKQRGE